TLTKHEPDFSTWEDIYFGLDLAKAAAGLDIGQTVAVKSKAIVAVEALEGTDSLIRRAGKISRGRVVIVKVSKPKQDMRFDIPVVGLNTVKNLVKAKAACLAFEAGKTLFIDKEESIRLADKKGISIVAL
ncbi:LpxI family protein, partial [bacterium]